MDLLKTEDVASVTLFEIRISESELQVLSDALSYLLKMPDDKHLTLEMRKSRQNSARTLKTEKDTKSCLQVVEAALFCRFFAFFTTGWRVLAGGW